MFIVTGHEKGADDGIGAVLKSSTRRAMLSNNILLSTVKDFCEFSHKHQLEPVNTSNKQDPRIRVFFLDSKGVQQIQESIMKVRGKQLCSSGN